MNSKKTPPTAPVDAVVIWLDSAPDAAKEWLQSVTTINSLVAQRNESFQQIGRYDGAMSDQCKALFREQYEFLSRVVEWCQSR